MPSQMIPNPFGADSETDYSAGPGVEYGEYKAGGAITANTIVKLNTTGQVVAAASAVANIVGVAIDAASAAGSIVKVIRLGTVSMTAGTGGVTALDIVSADASGNPATQASPTVGTNLGVALATAAAGAAVLVLVKPC